MRKRILFNPIAALFLFLAACSSSAEVTEPTVDVIDDGIVTSTAAPNGEQATSTADEEVPEFDIVTLLPRDAIPAIDDPEFYSVEQADREYAPEEQVLGVVFNGEARAYSTGLLSSHEIVNDTVGGRKIAVTW